MESYKIEHFSVSKTNDHVENDPTDYGRLWKELNRQQAENELKHGSLFNGQWYKPWRMVRMMKLCKLMGGKGWFGGKRILELGCGHGHVSKMLKDWGANPLATDGREWCVEATNYYWPDLEVKLVDQTKDYDLGKFDLVIHWGISHHLPPDAWEYDLMCAVGHAPVMSYECEVVDSSDPKWVKINSNDTGGMDKSLTGVGTFLSAAAVERCFGDIGCSFKRYDDRDLDCGSCHYSWKEMDSGDFNYGHMRLWMVHGT